LARAASRFLGTIHFVDLYHAKKDSIKYDHLWYTRSKTRKEYCIKIQPEAAVILKRYSGKEHLLFFADKYTDVRNALKFVNKHLKPLGLLINHNNLSTYYARHSWATIAKISLKKSEPEIAQALGHGSDTVTGIYTKAVLLDQWEHPNGINREVIDTVLSVKIEQ
jgi:integrase